MTYTPPVVKYTRRGRLFAYSLLMINKQVWSQFDSLRERIPENRAIAQMLALTFGTAEI